MAITKPLLAVDFDADKAVYPYLATPKVDGIRFLMVGGRALSRSFKPIKNAHIQAVLSKHLPDGIDGELTCGDSFGASTSAIMSSRGQPAFVAWIFDFVTSGDAYRSPGGPLEDPLRVAYVTRLARLKEWYGTVAGSLPFQCRVLADPVDITCADQVTSASQTFVDQGFEGAILRSPSGRYKCGRATLKENIILKVKDFVDAEAVVIGFVELMHNGNEALPDAFGRSKRSTAKAGKEGGGTLGALLVKARGDHFPADTVFKIGTGFDAQQRREIWEHQAKYMGALAKYKFMRQGVKDKPRHPTFLGWRHLDDMSPTDLKVSSVE